MHLVPESSIIQKEPRITFGQLNEALLLQAKDHKPIVSPPDDFSIGCSVSKDEVSDSFIQKVGEIAYPRRRMQHVDGPAACNNVTNFFCWYHCLDIPDYQKAASYVNDGYSLYCLDPAVLASSNNQVSQAVQPCADGFNHNSNCLGSWQPTAPGVHASTVEVNNTNSLDLQFCYGGTSMYMDGFHWQDTSCVIYLFPSWVLSTPGKVIAASFGSFVFGILVELIVSERRRLASLHEAGYRRLLTSGLFYGIQLTMAYMLMLVIMTYSGPLFLSVVIGLVMGHLLFNAKDALWARKSPAAAYVTAESRKSDDTAEIGKAACCPRETCNCPVEPESSLGDTDIPEGPTPCCQHD